MSAVKVRVLLAVTSALAVIPSVGDLASQERAPRWYKGNLHTHTINSDGDSAPDAVARWYKEHRYNFLALTDHNYRTDPQGLAPMFEAQDRFLLVSGEEVTSGYRDVPVHVNAFGGQATIGPAIGKSVFGTVQRNVDRIREEGAVPSLNHPLYRWAIDAEILRQVRGLGLFEIYNGHPATNDEWGLEAMWDAALTAGRKLYGIAVDDAHNFKRIGPDLSNPGRGWIEVKASELTEEALLAAISRGEFYASTGVRLATLERGATGLELRVEQIGDEKHRTRFIGSDGRVLDEVVGLEAKYRLRSDDGYVRATIVDSAGRRAWVQPVFAD